MVLGSWFLEHEWGTTQSHMWFLVHKWIANGAHIEVHSMNICPVSRHLKLTESMRHLPKDDLGYVLSLCTCTCSLNDYMLGPSSERPSVTSFMDIHNSASVANVAQCETLGWVVEAQCDASRIPAGNGAFVDSGFAFCIVAMILAEGQMAFRVLAFWLSN